MSLRVLHVVTTPMRRGAEMFAADLVAALGGDGIEQRVLLLRRGTGPSLEFAAPNAVLPSGRLSAPPLRVRVKTLTALRSEARAFRPDVIHAHGGEPLKYVVSAGAARAAPVLYRRIAAAPRAVLRGPRRAAHGRLMRRAAHIVAVTEGIRRETIDVFRVPEGRVTTIPRGVDARRVEPERGREAVREHLGIPRDAPVLLSLGALTWEKDPAAHVEIARLVAREEPSLVHLIVGDGPLRPVVEAAVAGPSRGGTSRLLGTRSDVGDLLSAADVMLLASRTEGMPGVVVEAGIAGLPVAAYAVGGVAEVVVDEETGRLAPAGDLEALAETVLSLLRDDAARARMGTAARTRCLERFEIGRVATRYGELYRSLGRTG